MVLSAALMIRTKNKYRVYFQGVRVFFVEKIFFFKKVNALSFREFYWLLESKIRKKNNFKPFWSYIDFGKMLKKTEKSKSKSMYRRPKFFLLTRMSQKGPRNKVKVKKPYLEWFPGSGQL
jgi:hypothetical protein